MWGSHRTHRDAVVTVAVRLVSRDRLSLNPELLLWAPGSAQGLAACQKTTHTSSLDAVLVPGASWQRRPLGAPSCLPPITDTQPCERGAH